MNGPDLICCTPEAAEVQDACRDAARFSLLFVP